MAELFRTTPQNVTIHIKDIYTEEELIDKLENDVAFFVRSSLPPVEGIFYDGQIFDAYAQIISLIKRHRLENF